MTENACKIRLAGFDDAMTIVELVRSFPAELVPRALPDIVQNIDRFLVAEVNGAFAGTVSWQILPEIGAPRNPTLEIKSLAVRKEFQRMKVGKILVEAALDRIRPLHPAQVIVLTFTPDFFATLGFRAVPKETLMHKIYTGCINCTKYDSPFVCPETAMVLDIRPPAPGKV